MQWLDFEELLRRPAALSTSAKSPQQSPCQIGTRGSPHLRSHVPESHPDSFRRARGSKLKGGATNFSGLSLRFAEPPRQDDKNLENQEERNEQGLYDAESTRHCFGSDSVDCGGVPDDCGCRMAHGRKNAGLLRTVEHPSQAVLLTNGTAYYAAVARLRVKNAIWGDSLPRW